MNEVTLFSLLYLTYFLSYVSRKNIIFIAPHLLQYGFSKADLGASQSTFSACYLVSKLSSNIVCNWASPRLVLSIGITSVGIINVVAGLLDRPDYLWLLWGLNGVCSGLCWPPIGVLIVSNFPEHKRGKIWSLIASSMNVGSTISPILTDFLVLYTSWNLSFTLTGLVDILLGVVLFSILPHPDRQSTKLPTKSNDSTIQRQPWRWDMLLNKFMFFVCFGYIIITFGIIAMTTWGQMLFIEKLGVDTLTAGTIVSVYEIGGFCGSTTSGFIADHVAQKYTTKGSPRSYSTVLCTGITCLSAVALQYLPPSFRACQVCAFGYGFGMFGTTAMFGLMTREYVSREHSGTLTAVMGVASQLGGFCAGSPLAWFYDKHSISDGFWIIAYVLPLAFVCMCFLMMINGKYKEKKK